MDKKTITAYIFTLSILLIPIIPGDPNIISSEPTSIYLVLSFIIPILIVFILFIISLVNELKNYNIKNLSTILHVDSDLEISRLSVVGFSIIKFKRDNKISHIDIITILCFIGCLQLFVNIIFSFSSIEILVSTFIISTFTFTSIVIFGVLLNFLSLSRIYLDNDSIKIFKLFSTGFVNIKYDDIISIEKNGFCTKIKTNKKEYILPNIVNIKNRIQKVIVSEGLSS